MDAHLLYASASRNKKKKEKVAVSAQLKRPRRERNDGELTHRLAGVLVAVGLLQAHDPLVVAVPKTTRKESRRENVAFFC